MKQLSMVTTIDNPYNPFTQFDEWNAFDVQKGYNTLAYLARITRTSDELSQEDEDEAIELAVNEIVNMNILGIYKRVVQDTEQTSTN